MKHKFAGLPVVDATKRVILTITHQDILSGKAGSPAACAAARACMRQMHAPAVRVHMSRIYIMKGKKWVRYVTPQSMRSEMIAYDRRTSFKPGDYVINALVPSHRGTDRHKDKNYKAGYKVKNKKPRAKPHFVTGVRVRAS